MGLVADIGPGSMWFNADQGNAYVLGAGHNERLSILELVRPSTQLPTSQMDQKISRQL
jgi:hypothetical protein